MKSKKLAKVRKLESNSSLKSLWIIPLFALIVKIIIILNIAGFSISHSSFSNLSAGLESLLKSKINPDFAWLGADGENYIDGLLGLVQDGFYSGQETLSYWPAGYPLLMWLVSFIFGSNIFLWLSIIQSLFYSICCYFFAKEISRTKLKPVALLTVVILSFNPTLALNTMSIGYELPVTSCLIIASALMIRNFRIGNRNLFDSNSFLAVFFLALATLMQPRLLLLGVVVFVFWALNKKNLKNALTFLLIQIILLALPLSILIHRNVVANGFSAVSTNLGTTINIGIGPDATGGYESGRESIPCIKADEAKNKAQADQERVKCALLWQVKNPTKTLVLMSNKAKFFWSPWFGSEANGTMARNPWALNHPFKGLLSNPDGFKLVTGPVGAAISWIWMILSLALLVRGSLVLFGVGKIERAVGLMSFAVVMANMATSMLTIGDHRFRIPTMGLSLFLQVVGLRSLFSRSRAFLEDSKESNAWPGFSWRGKGRDANLRT